MKLEFQIARLYYLTDKPLKRLPQNFVAKHPTDSLPLLSVSGWLRKQKTAVPFRYLAGNHKAKSFYGKLTLASDLSLVVQAGSIHTKYFKIHFSFVP